MALLAQRHRDGACWLVLPSHTSNVPLLWGVSLPGASSSPALKMQTFADSSQPEVASLESSCSASSAHGTARTESQRLGLLACIAHVKLEIWFWRTVQGVSGSPAPEMQTSAGSWQTERASLESCCSTSSAHVTARTEVQRLGLHACLATSNFKRIPGRGGPAGYLQQQYSENVSR